MSFLRDASRDDTLAFDGYSEVNSVLKLHLIDIHGTVRPLPAVCSDIRLYTLLELFDDFQRGVVGYRDGRALRPSDDQSRV